MKKDFYKYGGEAIAILLKDYFHQILQLEDISIEWNSSFLINIDKGRQDKQKLDNKRGMSLTSYIAKLFEKILINGLNNTEAQTGAQPGKNTLTSLLATEDDPKSRNIFCFYELRKDLRQGLE